MDKDVSNTTAWDAVFAAASAVGTDFIAECGIDRRHFPGVRRLARRQRHAAVDLAKRALELAVFPPHVAACEFIAGAKRLFPEPGNRAFIDAVRASEPLLTADELEHVKKRRVLVDCFGGD